MKNSELFVRQFLMHLLVYNFLERAQSSNLFDSDAIALQRMMSLAEGRTFATVEGETHLVDQLTGTDVGLIRLLPCPSEAALFSRSTAAPSC